MRKLVFIFISILRLAHVSNYFFPGLLPTFMACLVCSFFTTRSSSLVPIPIPLSSGKLSMSFLWSVGKCFSSFYIMIQCRSIIIQLFWLKLRLAPWSLKTEGCQSHTVCWMKIGRCLCSSELFSHHKNKIECIVRFLNLPVFCWFLPLNFARNFTLLLTCMFLG